MSTTTTCDRCDRATCDRALEGWTRDAALDHDLCPDCVAATQPARVAADLAKFRAIARSLLGLLPRCIINDCDTPATHYRVADDVSYCDTHAAMANARADHHERVLPTDERPAILAAISALDGT